MAATDQVMTCDEIQARGIAEDFLHNRLTAQEREAYERHFFDCDRCFAGLEALRAVRAELVAQRSPAVPATAVRSTSNGWLALAAMLVIGAGGAIFLMRTGSAPAPPPVTQPAENTAPPIEARPDDAIARLARFDPPPYTPARLRSPAASAEFDAAMRRYAGADYAGAIRGLRSVSRDPDVGETARLFLGISLLMTEQFDEGVGVLNALGGDPRGALAEDARFFKARGELLRGNTAAAVAALDQTIALGGDREPEARALRQAIRSLDGSK